MNKEAIKAYVREWTETFALVLDTVHEGRRSDALSNDLIEAGAIVRMTRDIIGPFVYWLERHDTEFMEAKDPDFNPMEDFVPAYDRAAAEKKTPKTSPSPSPPPDSSVKVTVSGKTFKIRDKLKSHGLKWNPNDKTWEGAVDRKELIGLMRFCDENGVEIYEG